jgi:predicted RNA binding protein YcfA (HicA-like mRNA interferase family)
VTPKPPAVSGRELVKILSKMGYQKVSQRGSHIKLKKEETGSVLVIPDHKELDRWTLRTILKQADLSEEILKEYL